MARNSSLGSGTSHPATQPFQVGTVDSCHYHISKAQLLSHEYIILNDQCKSLVSNVFPGLPGKDTSGWMAEARKPKTLIKRLPNATACNRGLIYVEGTITAGMSCALSACGMHPSTGMSEFI